MRSFVCFAASCCFLAASCIDSSNIIMQDSDFDSLELTADEALALSYRFGNNAVSEEEALESAMSVMDMLDNTAGTKAAHPRSIASISPVMSSKVTKSGYEACADTMAYVVNFNDSLGYVMLSADRRTFPVLAVIPAGNIDFNDEDLHGMDSCGVEVFYCNVMGALEAQKAEAQALQDSLLEQAMHKLEARGMVDGTRALSDYYDIRYETTSVIRFVAEMITVEWGQDSPYNLKTPVKSGMNCKTGCVATALAQAMSYWEYPSTYDWAVMKGPEGTGPSTAKGFLEISRLMADAGAGINTNYGINESSASLSSVPAYVRSLGYNPGTYAAYNESALDASIRNKRPVLMCGSAKKNDVYKTTWWGKKKFSHTYYTEGHAWVVDARGFCQVWTTGYLDDLEVFAKMNVYYVNHCNWGDPSHAYNGWYMGTAFDINNSGPILEDTRSSSTTTSGTSGLYQYEVYAITEMYPNR